MTVLSTAGARLTVLVILTFVSEFFQNLRHRHNPGRHCCKFDVIKMAELCSFLPFCSASTLVNSLPNEHQNLEKTSFSTLLYSNVRGLRQASGELCRMCTEFHPSIVCLSETHLCDDATDSFCPPGYVVAARRDRSKHGGGVLILLREVILFEEIDTAVFSIVEKAELVAVCVQSFIIICCYHQPSSVDVTLLNNLDHVLDKYPSLSPVVCGDFNVHESTWLNSTHTTRAGTATLDFCESRGLHQLVAFPTRLNAILDLVMTEYPGSVQALPNLNTSDHVAVLLMLSSLTYVSTPPDRLVYHWSRTPWDRLHHYFNSRSVDAAVSFVTAAIVLATQKFVPTSIISTHSMVES